MNSRLIYSVILFFFAGLSCPSFTWGLGKILIPMDLQQNNHLKAYGLAYASLAQGLKVEWLLNYRGGSFFLESLPAVAREAGRRGVLFESLNDAECEQIYVAIDAGNMDKITLEKAPRIAVYTPLTKQPWDDAVTLALTYAEIPYTKIYDSEIIEGKLKDFDWLHLHHEDFTGQNSKFFAAFRGQAWYQLQVTSNQKSAQNLGFPNNVMLKKAVVLAIRDYVEKGGFLFAMCLACNTLDVALAATKTDIVDMPFDGSPVAKNAQKALDFNLSLAFENFHVDTDPMSPSHDDIDYNQVNAGPLKRRPASDFVLFNFAAKYDPVPSMLVQNHTDVIPGFLGLATTFRKAVLKKGLTILAESNGQEAVRYIHGNLGQGHFTYYGGHDPEDYSHAVGDSPTDLNLHKNSPGYRLILNNILYPAAKQKKRKT